LVTDDKGAILAYASIFVKGTTRGTTSNNQGKYFLDLEEGNYTIVCQYVGYTRQERQVTVGSGMVTIKFQLTLQLTTMKEEIIKSR
jgi:hypothetical protein